MKSQSVVFLEIFKILMGSEVPITLKTIYFTTDCNFFQYVTKWCFIGTFKNKINKFYNFNVHIFTWRKNKRRGILQLFMKRHFVKFKL